MKQSFHFISADMHTILGKWRATSENTSKATKHRHAALY